MAKNLKKFKGPQTAVLLATLSAILLFSSHINIAKCLPANSMWIEPNLISLEDTPVGFKFNVTIYTNLTVPSYAWQFYLTYNKNHLNVTGCWYSAGAKSEWAGPRPTSPLTPSHGTHNDTHNYILFGESLLGIVETPAGSYSLAIVEFEVVDVPPVGEVYQSELRLDIIDPFHSYVLDSDLNEIRPQNFGKTDYIIDEFSMVMLMTGLLIITAYVIALKKKFKSKLTWPQYTMLN